jgi:hypothetical protein
MFEAFAPPLNITFLSDVTVRAEAI